MKASITQSVIEKKVDILHYDLVTKKTLPAHFFIP
jgi:hypothetical protein